MIFAFVVGLGALALSTMVWTLSFPVVAWKLSVWLAPETTAPTKGEVTEWIESRLHAFE